jgi:Na+-transporting NADH:ubiquinone oxidoreductase subunit D
MSVNTTEAPAVRKPEARLFSRKNRALITDPLGESNPITIQVLGICSALAITVQVEQAVVMTLSVIAVLTLGNVIISLLRNLIPNRIRIIVQLVVIASLVILVDETLKAYSPDISRKLSVFVGLIITNCIIMGRLEGFGLQNGPWESFLDGLGNALGYGWILIAVAAVREFFGSGSLYGIQLIPDSWYVANGGFYMNNNFMILPPMALIVVGVIIWIQRARNPKLVEEQ